MKLENRTAIVTGGAGYIGSTAAARLAAEGASVIICDICAGEARKVADRINAEGGCAEAMGTDVSNTESIENMVDHVIDKYGQIRR